jgi:hypothetical protein
MVQGLGKKSEGVRPTKKGERKQGGLHFNSSSSYLAPYPFNLLPLTLILEPYTLYPIIYTLYPRLDIQCSKHKTAVALKTVFPL